MRSRIEERDAEPAIDQVRSFLGSYFGDAYSLEEVRDDLRRLALTSTSGVQRDLDAIVAVLANPPADGELARLVGWYGNWVLDDPSDAGATAFLEDLAEMLRQVIAEAPPPPHLRTGEDSRRPGETTTS